MKVQIIEWACLLKLGSRPCHTQIGLKKNLPPQKKTIGNTKEEHEVCGKRDKRSQTPFIFFYLFVSWNEHLQ